MTSSRVGRTSAQLSSESSSLMKTRKVPFSPWSPRPAPEPPRLSGVYRIEAATLWDLACFHFCSQLSGLHGHHLQVSAYRSPTMQSHEAPLTSHTPLWPLFSSAQLPVLCLPLGRAFLAPQTNFVGPVWLHPSQDSVSLSAPWGCGALILRHRKGTCVAALDWPSIGWLFCPDLFLALGLMYLLCKDVGPRLVHVLLAFKIT